MIGAILGDIVGSIYEFDNIKTKEFELFDKECFFTDDSVMTIAIAEALMQYENIDENNIEKFKEKLVDVMHEIGIEHPDCGYGGHFLMWILLNKREPYNSFGNGSAMRVSSVGWYAKTLEEAELIAKATAEVKKHSLSNSSNSFVLILSNSYIEPTISPKIAPIIIYSPFYLFFYNPR